MSWTAVKFANAAARVFDLDEDGKTRIHRVVRNQVAKGVLPTTPDPNDGRGALLFDDKAAAVALLLIPMADMDITVRGLREAAGDMLRKRSDPTKPVRIEEALIAVREGKRVELVTRLRWNSQTAEIGRYSRFEITEGEPEGEPNEIMRHSKFTVGEEAQAQKSAEEGSNEILGDYEKLFVNLAELRIPASDLLAAFFEEGVA